MDKIFLLTFLIFSVTQAQAQSAKGSDNEVFQCKPNACGPSGWLGIIVPDRFLDCDFKRACDQHDICYSRCETCGDLHGSSLCDGTCEQKRERKNECDINFRTQIAEQNNDKSHCNIAATAYFLAVTWGGCNYFRAPRQFPSIRDEFQTNFIAVLKWLETNPDEARKIEVELALARLAILEAGKDNQLHFMDNMLTVAPDQRRAQQSTKETRLLVNGIDISEAELEASVQEVENAFSGLRIEEVSRRK